MPGFPSVLLLAFLSGASADTYHNRFGVACKDGQTDCAQDRCIPVGSRQACTQCKPGYVPIDGRCQGYSEAASSPCAPDDPVSPTRCVACSQDGTFLFYGGCYSIGQPSSGSMGGLLCSKASGGKCTECKKDASGSYVFTNPDTGAAEGCILCSDTVGFSGYKGASGCLDCLPPITEKVGTALCARCHYTNEDRHHYPIDYKCQASGPHGCINGYCTSCYKTHLFYEFGCYSRRSSTRLAICAEANQYELDTVTICKECANSSYAPKDGECTPTENGVSSGSSFSECTKDKDKGLCTGCSNSADYFLFYGGCYNRHFVPGSKLCSAVASGACTKWKMQFDFIFNKGDNSGGYLCGDAANGGVSGCATCSYASGAVTCTRCSAGYLGVDGRSCGKGCSGNTQGACAEIANESRSTVVSCRCVCKPTFYNSSGTCASCTDSCAVCKDGTSTGCQQCSPGKILNFPIASSESADCVNQCVAGSECAECGLAIDGSRYCTRCKDSGMYPFNGVCIAEPAQRDAYCTTKANGVCTTCSSSAFLMNGGCYTTAHYPGDTICDKQADGKCTATKEGYGISADGKRQPCAPECLECAAPGPGRCTRCPPGKLLRRAPAAATGSCVEPGACADGYYADGDACLPCVVPGCRACGRTSFCTECAGELFVGLDGKACLRECSGDRVVGEVSDGTRRCWCERGFAPALDRSGCVPAAECPPGMPWCASCDESGRCLSCAAPGHNIQVDQRTCAEGCGDRASPNQGVCVCEVDAVLTKGACVSAREVARKRVAAIAGGTMAGVVVVGGLVGFLCWWFLYRGKRAGAFSSTTALVRPKSM